MVVVLAQLVPGFSGGFDHEFTIMFSMLGIVSVVQICKSRPHEIVLYRQPINVGNQAFETREIVGTSYNKQTK
jgi:hypothetical protein